MSKRKHRVVVEVTLDQPGSERDAVRALHTFINIATKDTPYFPQSVCGIIKLSRPKEFSRVFRAELSDRICNTPEFCGET